MKKDYPDPWSHFYTFLFVGVFLYYARNQVFAILAVVGAYFFWKEWEKTR